MANKRMFNKTICRTDNFVAMPATAQNLYFHLGLEADDDGFVTPQMVMKTLGSPEDDLKILIVKGFVIPFGNKVVVITHWKIHNKIAKDRYHKTIYQEEFKELSRKQNVYNLYTENRLALGKNEMKIDKEKILTADMVGGEKGLNDVEMLAKYFIHLKGIKERPARYYRAAANLLIICDNSLEKAKLQINKTKEWADGEQLEFELETVIKKYPELSNK